MADDNNDKQPARKSIAFKTTARHRRNVQTDWWESLTPNIMAEGFKELADMGVGGSKCVVGRIDRFFYPIATLYRHYLELQMKNLVRIGSRYLPDADLQKVQNHDLKNLWALTRKVIAAHWGTDQQRGVEVVNDVILEFHRWDRSGQAFRYYTDKNGKVNLEHEPTLIDPYNLGRVIGKVHRFLSTCQFGIEAELDQMDQLPGASFTIPNVR